MIPNSIIGQLEEWSNKTDISVKMLESQLQAIFNKLRDKVPMAEDEELWEIAKDKLYGDEIRDILKSNAKTYVQLFIGVSQLRDRNSWRKMMAEKAKREDMDRAVSMGLVNEDGKPLSASGKVLRQWWSRMYLAFSVESNKLSEDPKMNMFLGQLNGKKAQLFGKKPKRGPDPMLQPKIGEWYRVRWQELKDEYPIEIQTQEGDTMIFRTLGRSAKVTNFSVKEEAMERSGKEVIIDIIKNYPKDHIIPIEKEGIDLWSDTYIVVDNDEEGNDIKDWNAFGLMIGRLLQVNTGAFPSIVLKSLHSDSEIRILMDDYTMSQMLEGAGIGSTVGVFVMPYFRAEKDEEGETIGGFWEARGLGGAVLTLIPPMDLDDDEYDDEIIDEEDDIEVLE